jgi:protein-S-isoprenylcysteine O-methyltransferase Ste14
MIDVVTIRGWRHPVFIGITIGLVLLAFWWDSVTAMLLFGLALVVWAVLKLGINVDAPAAGREGRDALDRYG